MLTKRIIPCLDVRNGRVVKGVNFEGLHDVSDPVELAAFYSDSGADELVFYDITASFEERKLFTDCLRAVAAQIFIPLTVGGGINSIDDFDRVLKCGADKVSVNSGAIRDPSLIAAAAKKYGAQCVVLSADVKRVDGQFRGTRGRLRRSRLHRGFCRALPELPGRGRRPCGVDFPLRRGCDPRPEGPSCRGGHSHAPRTKSKTGDRSMIAIDDLKFDEKGLIPAIVQDADSGRVLTLAYMNRESLGISLERRLTCFWSRSRQELWLKGETSGNYQHIVSITADCDHDALLVRVHPDGPACHLGTASCFENPLLIGEEAFSLDGLYALLTDRKAQLPEGSYTSYLFQKGIDKILKKVGEECTEVIVAGKGGERAETVYEIADLAYHVMVLMVEMGIRPEEIRRELASRHVIDHKVKQEKMA